MKRKTVIISLFLILIISFLNATINANSQEPPKYYENSHFNYSINPGDEFFFDIFSNMTLSFDNESIYPEIGEWLADNIFGREMNMQINQSQEILNNFTKLITHNFQLRIIISNIYRNESDSNSIREINDYINGSIQMKDESAKDWKSPKDFKIDILDDISTFLLYSMGMNISDIDSAQSNLLDVIEQFNFNLNFNDTFQEKIFVGTQKLDSEGNPITNPYLPEQPIPPSEYFAFLGSNDLLFSSLLNIGENLFLPKTTNLENIYDFIKDDINWKIKNGTINETDTYDQLISNYGITGLTVNSHGIAAVINSDNLNQSSLDELIGNEELISLISGENFQNWNMVMHQAIEYDKNWALASQVLYIDALSEIDTSNLISEGRNLPYMKNEPFNLNYVYGIHQEGISIPSQELIEQGIIGDARLTTRGIQG
ncbi:MAG: hypothetical protein ACTSUI_03805, partial [Promethearchaeota archaeon]